MGYTFTYPYVLPPGFGGVPSVALDSKGNLWVFQRADMGKPQLFKFDPNYKLILEIGNDVIGYQSKAHGMAVDAEDNVWITSAGNATVQKISPDGKLLLTLGQSGRRGDWDEAKGQRLLWEPVMVAFAPNGDVYIGEGHGNESPNDTDSDDPANNSGASRIIHVDKNGKFKNQWFGNEVGQGKFNSAHGLAVDPTNGDVWIGDREDYRIVVYSGDGKFLKTMQMRNLVCALYFDSKGQSVDGQRPGRPVPEDDARRQDRRRDRQRHGHRPRPVHRGELLGDGQAGQPVCGRHERRARDEDGGAEEVISIGRLAIVVPTFRSATLSASRSTGSANKGSRRGKTPHRRLSFHAMALGPGLVLAEVAGSVFCLLRRHADYIVCCTDASGCGQQSQREGLVAASSTISARSY